MGRVSENRCKLTDEIVDSIKAQDKRVRFHDTGQTGLYVAIYPSGVKSFWVRYNVKQWFDDKQYLGPDQWTAIKEQRIVDSGDFKIALYNGKNTQRARAVAREVIAAAEAGQYPRKKPRDSAEEKALDAKRAKARILCNWIDRYEKIRMKKAMSRGSPKSAAQIITHIRQHFEPWLDRDN